MCVCAQAATVVVDPNGLKDHTTIQAAITDANNGDTIIVNPGRYYENVIFPPSSFEITVTSTNPDDPTVVAATIIDGNDLGAAVTFNSAYPTTVLTGLTITNVRANEGGGINIYGGVNLLFADNSVRKVGLKGLWELDWHRDWNPTNSPPPDYGNWPFWMANFKEYYQP